MEFPESFYTSSVRLERQVKSMHRMKSPSLSTGLLDSLTADMDDLCGTDLCNFYFNNQEPYLSRVHSQLRYLMCRMLMFRSLWQSQGQVLTNLPIFHVCVWNKALGLSTPTQTSQQPPKSWRLHHKTSV